MFKYFVSRTRDQFRRGAMTPVGCCGWSLVHTSRVALNVLHATALTTTFWLVLLLGVQTITMAGFGLLHELATQAATFSGAASTVRATTTAGPRLHSRHVTALRRDRHATSCTARAVCERVGVGAGVCRDTTGPRP